MGSPLLAEYEEQGFVFCPDVLSAAEVGVLTADLDQVLASASDGRRVILEADGVTPRTVVNPHLYRDAYARLVRHPALLATVEELLGEQVYAWQMGVNCKAAFAGDVWFWHQDYPAYLEDDHIPAPRMVNALIFLDEVTTLNSPLFCAGSYPSRARCRGERSGTSTPSSTGGA
jgi:ectoine hydroxylase